MRCDICRSAEAVVVIPLSEDYPLHVCPGCIKDNGWFCFRHDCLHNVFTDGSSYCLQCVLDTIGANRDYAQGYYDELQRHLPLDEFNRLEKRAIELALQSANSPAWSVLAFMAIAAARYGKPLDMVFDELLGKQNVSLILLVS